MTVLLFHWPEQAMSGNIGKEHSVLTRVLWNLQKVQPLYCVVSKHRVLINTEHICTFLDIHIRAGRWLAVVSSSSDPLLHHRI